MTNTVYHNDKVTPPLMLGVILLLSGVFYTFNGFAISWLLKGLLASATIVGGGFLLLNGILKFRLVKSLEKEGIQKMNWDGFFRYHGGNHPTEHATADMVAKWLNNRFSNNVTDVHIWNSFLGKKFEVYAKYKYL